MSIARSRMPRMPWDEASAPGGQAATVVAHASARPRRRSRSSAELDLVACGVPGDVRQRLLRDAVDDELLLLGQRQARSSCRLDSQLRLLAERGRQRASALCSPRSSSASGRSRRAMRRTSSVPSRAVSRSSSSCSRRSSGSRRQPFDLQHHAGERLADLVVQLARDPLRSPSCTRSARRALSRRSDSSRSSISLNVRASAATSGSPSTAHALPGESGSCRRIVSASSSSGRKAGRNRRRLIASIMTSPTDQHDQLGEVRRHRHGDRREHQPEERQHSTAAFVANTRQNSGSEERRAHRSSLAARSR